MSTAAFDTLKATEDLEAAGFEEAHARAIVRTVHRAMNEGVATKEHVSAEVATPRADLQTLRADVHALHWHSVGALPQCGDESSAENLLNTPLQFIQ